MPDGSIEFNLTMNDAAIRMDYEQARILKVMIIAEYELKGLKK